MKEEIKPCPFCGKEPEVQQDENFFGMTEWWIACLNFDCPVDNVTTGSFAIKQKAINAWNKRSDR